MPTRIVVQQPAQHQQQQEQLSHAAAATGASSSHPDHHAGGATSTPRTPRSKRGRPPTPTSSSSPRFGLTRQAAKSLSGGRNLGRQSRHSDARANVGTERQPQQQQHQQAPSKRDIVASPRLLGYMLNFIASLICMVSAVKFQRNTTTELPPEVIDSVTNSSSNNRLLSGEGGGTNFLRDDDVGEDPVEVVGTIDGGSYFDVALVVGGPEHRLFDPYQGVRIMQQQENDVISVDNTTDIGTGLDTSTNNVTGNVTDVEFNSNNTIDTTLNVSENIEIPTSMAPTLEGDGEEEQSQSSFPTQIPSNSSSSQPTATPTRNDTSNFTEVNDLSPSQVSKSPTVSPSQSMSTTIPRPTISPQPSTSTGAPTSAPTYVNFVRLRVVDYWKMWGAIILPSVGCAVTFLIILVHFDNVFFPEVWRDFFEDGGSKSELLLIWGLIVFWILGLYVCTGVGSVGYVQANVFFSAWAAFGSSAMTYKLWREGAGKDSLLDVLTNHRRMTTYNWFWICFFSAITLFSLTDLYAHRNSTSSIFGISLTSVDPRTWRQLWILTGVTTGLSFAVPVTNHFLTRPNTDRREATRKFRILFRQVEGIILLAMLGMYAYIITNFTGVNSPINGINNPYLGTWGTFLSIVLAFSTWLRDGKNVAWVHVEGDAIMSSLTSRNRRRSDG